MPKEFFYYIKNEKKFYVIIIYKVFIEREASSNAYVIVHENKVHLIDSDMKGFIKWDYEEYIKTIFF